MYQNVKWLRLTPDRPGRGGQKSGLHSFQQEPLNDTRSVYGFHIYQGAWRTDIAGSPMPTLGNTNLSSPIALHIYTYPASSDPAASPSSVVLYQAMDNGVSSAIVREVASGITRLQRGPGFGIFSSAPGVFKTINGRCFFGDGLGEAYIFDNRSPVIHQQLNQKLGISVPQQALTLGGAGPYGTGYAYKGSNYINHPNPNSQNQNIVTSDVVQVGFLHTNLSMSSGAVATGTTVTSGGVSSNTSPFSATGTISITSGTSLVVLAGATWPANFQYCGLAINFNGYSFVIQEHGAQASAFTLQGVATTLSNTQLLIAGIYTGPDLSGVPYTITGTQFQMSGVGWPWAANFVNYGTLGYGQNTNCNLMQVRLFATRSNGLYRNLGNISLGPVGGGSRSTVTDARMAATLNQVSSASNPFVATDIGKTIVVDQAAAAPVNGMLITTITGVTPPNWVTTADTNASGGTVTNVRAWWGTGFNSAADAAITNGTNVLTSPSNPFTIGDIGKFVMIEKAATGPVALFTTITGFTNAGSVTVAANATVTVTSGRAVWGGGTSNTTVGPTYAYAWYDPETGHMSNISPLTQIPKPTSVGSFADFANCSMSFPINPGLLAFPEQTIDATRFSHIMFFRTLSTGGSTLYPIGSLQPFMGKTTASDRGQWTPALLQGWVGYPSQWANVANSASPFFYDFSSDSDLLLSGGFRAPQYTNSKPMATLRGGSQEPAKPWLMAYWDGRLWVVSVQEPDKLSFSCDSAQCPLGIPEESFPATNFLRVFSEDNRIVALRVFGDTLIVNTDRFTYMVKGNNESNYRLLKISSGLPGVGQYQMDEFPSYSGAAGEPITVYFLGRDAIVYRWVIGGDIQPISAPVQDLLDLAFKNTNFRGYYIASRVHSVSAWGRRFIVVSASGAFWYSLSYDVDRGVWFNSKVQDSRASTNDGVPASYATGYSGDANYPIVEAFATRIFNLNAVIVNTWVNDTISSSAPTLAGPNTIETFPLNFDGKKTRKQIVAVNIHATDVTNSLSGPPWSGYIKINESVTANFTFGSYPDLNDSIYYYNGVVASPVDPSAKDLVVMAGNVQTPSTPLIGYRMSVGVVQNSLAVEKIFAIDIGYIDCEDPGEGDV